MDTDDIRKALAGSPKKKDKGGDSKQSDVKLKAAKAVQKYVNGDPEKFARALSAYIESCEEAD